MSNKYQIHKGLETKFYPNWKISKNFNDYLVNHNLYEFYLLIKEIIDDNLKKKIEIIKIENYIFKLPETSDYLEPTIEVFFKKKAGFKKFDYFRKFHQEFDKILAKRASSFDEFKKNKLLKNEFRIIISVL